VRYEQLGSTVICGGHCKERRCDESDFQLGLPQPHMVKSLCARVR
jgi:hypothetical protein